MSESVLKNTILTLKDSLEFLFFSLYISQNCIPLLRPHPGLDKLRARLRACTQLVRKEVLACTKLRARKSIKALK